MSDLSTFEQYYKRSIEFRQAGDGYCYSMWVYIRVFKEFRCCLGINYQYVARD